jgi:hypothetical protein
VRCGGLPQLGAREPAPVVGVGDAASERLGVLERQRGRARELAARLERSLDLVRDGEVAPLAPVVARFGRAR